MTQPTHSKLQRTGVGNRAMETHRELPSNNVAQAGNTFTAFLPTAASGDSMKVGNPLLSVGNPSGKAESERDMLILAAVGSLNWALARLQYFELVKVGTETNELGEAVCYKVELPTRSWQYSDKCLKLAETKAEE